MTSRARDLTGHMTMTLTPESVDRVSEFFGVAPPVRAPLRLTFTVDGAAVPKQRARQGTMKSGARIWYTPQRTVHFERRVRVAAWQALQERKRASKTRDPWPVDANYRLIVRLFFPDARRRDIDNCIKSVGDALNPRPASGTRLVRERAYIWNDDAQIKSVVGESQIDRVNPRTEVTIEVLAP